MPATGPTTRAKLRTAIHAVFCMTCRRAVNTTRCEGVVGELRAGRRALKGPRYTTSDATGERVSACRADPSRGPRGFTYRAGTYISVAARTSRAANPSGMQNGRSTVAPVSSIDVGSDSRPLTTHGQNWVPARRAMNARAASIDIGSRATGCTSESNASITLTIRTGQGIAELAIRSGYPCPSYRS